MSDTLFAYAPSDGMMYTVDKTGSNFNGNFTALSASGVTGSADMAYNCLDGKLYGVQGGVSDSQLYEVNQGTGAWSLIGNTGVTSCFGLAYDVVRNQMYGTSTSTDRIYDVNLATGAFTNPRLTGVDFPTALAYDSLNDKLYGRRFGDEVLYDVSLTTFSYTGVGSAAFNVQNGSQEYDSLRDKLYGISRANPPSMYEVNRTTGGYAPVVGPLNQASDGYALGYVGQSCICVHEAARLRTADSAEPVAIAEIQAGATVYDYRGEPVRVLANVESGRSSRFVRLREGALGAEQPAGELMITRGHPLLVGGREVLPEELVEGGRAGVSEVQLAAAARLFTLVTERRTFVVIEGVPVATWSEAAYRNFRANDERGRVLRVREQ